jgi:SAM-dependent methyltransferase
MNSNYVVLIPPRIRLLLRDLIGLRLKARELFVEEVRDKCGLEIGGPSGTFRDSGLVPLYRYVKSLDNCVFARTTIWEGTREHGGPFLFDERKDAGCNYVVDATDLEGITPHMYDFLLSAHNLEHIANPIRALRDWMRAVKPGGALILILPNYQKTFDHRRTPTPVSHMLEDAARGTTEDDSTHLEEVLALHDFSRDPIGGDYAAFRDRVLNNVLHRTVHHHVFDEHNSRSLLETVGNTVEHVELAPPHHIVILARTPQVPQTPSGGAEQ